MKSDIECRMGRKYISAPKNARTFRAERKIEQRTDNLGLLAKYNREKKIWEVWEVKDPTAFIKEPTEKIYEGRNIEKFLVTSHRNQANKIYYVNGQS